MFNQLSRDIHTPASTKNISRMLTDVPVVQVYGPVDAPVAGITTDSRKVAANWIFVALEGEHTDGHNFIQQAIENGASVVVIQRKQYEEYLSRLLGPAYAQHTQTTVIVVEDARVAVAMLAGSYYDYPATKMNMIGITGTNGKTTTAHYIKSILETQGETVGMLGTIQYYMAGNSTPAGLTTPMAEEIQEWLARIVAAGCTTCIMEVSSHALALKRVHNIMFDVAVYTNLSRDHLDFHGSFDEYAKAKSLLFKEHSKGFKILNADDQYQLVMWSDRDANAMTYGTTGEPDYLIHAIKLESSRTEFSLDVNGKTYRMETHLAGAFNASNAAAAFAVCDKMGIDRRLLISGIKSLEEVPGRFERIAGPGNVTAFVDYSHTPDSLEKAIVSLKEIVGSSGRVLVVFGCGGDRDKGKRPLMGSVAARLADLVIVTSDNPRTEEPATIIEEIVQGIPQESPVEIIQDRAAAIKKSVELSSPGDVILVAGKGHETYQIIGRERKHFSDSEELRRAFDLKTKGGQA